MPHVEYALSLKQPWATLLVRGVKTIEVRRWPTARVGRILIHAARVSAAEPGVWDLVPDAFQVEARLVGGIVGVGELTGCITYDNVEDFARDQSKHLNDPAWFRPPALYGFTFSGLQPLPFRPYPGWLRFFPVDEELHQRRHHRKSQAAQGDLPFP
ncbi:MAG: ASCH domain-containing protein [Gemmataceae bacterium]|nr:ASCH domain-containing protein [Gemmataceae bacterium]